MKSKIDSLEHENEIILENTKVIFLNVEIGRKYNDLEC